MHQPSVHTYDDSISFFFEPRPHVDDSILSLLSINLTVIEIETKLGNEFKIV